MSILLGDLVIVTAVDDVLSTVTGHMEELPILSLAVSRRTLINYPLANRKITGIKMAHEYLLRAFLSFSLLDGYPGDMARECLGSGAGLADA